MNEQGMCPSEDIYNSLLNCCCELGMYGDAVRLAEAMMEDGHLPLLESLNSLVCRLYDEGNKVKAKVLFCNLLHCGYNYDEVAWKILIDGLLKNGLTDGCSELLGMMEAKDPFGTQSPNMSPGIIGLKNLQTIASERDEFVLKLSWRTGHKLEAKEFGGVPVISGWCFDATLNYGFFTVPTLVIFAVSKLTIEVMDD
ncbi:hypothetical protein GH714_042350 [Hevea brasiliensis]|uniref:Pentatricopeptide repeat-containing protein n=1 Tax=Hevea brasiliensis TaxID=3981 RepID=A0A6A6KBC1_HEVBR|nr:hypothetical protein GH714_042350 [Hevea brasiliensis]